MKQKITKCKKENIQFKEVLTIGTETMHLLYVALSEEHTIDAIDKIIDMTFLYNVHNF